MIISVLHGQSPHQHNRYAAIVESVCKITRRSCLILLFLAAVVSAAGEFTLATVGAACGRIQSLESDGRGTLYVFYPEIRLGGNLPLHGFAWEAFWGYWDDDLSRPQIKDAIVYSSTGHLVGLRIRFEPTQLAPGLPLPIVVWCGLAHQFIALNDLGGGDYAGAQGVDQAAAADSWEIGALLHFGITPRAALRFELRRLYMFGDAIAGLSRRNRQSYSLGLEFTIGSNREK